MREILFRGKRMDNGEWIEGSLYTPFYNACYAQICIGRPSVRVNFDVKSTTVGQYTGLKDKNGKRIFEGDIVKMHYFFENIDQGTYGVFEDEEVLDVVIGIDPYGVSFEALHHGLAGYLHDYLEEPEEELEVIGNIYDNPELL